MAPVKEIILYIGCCSHKKSNTKPAKNYNEMEMLPDDEAFCGYVSGKH